MSTLDVEDSSIWPVIKREWPDFPWSNAEFKHGAFHQVAVLGSSAVVRIGSGQDHQTRTESEFRNLAAIEKINLPFQTPHAIGKILSTHSWSAQASTFVSGAHRNDSSWTVSREELQIVLSALQEPIFSAPGGFRPIRQWCGGTNWQELVERISHPLDERTRTATKQVVVEVLECEIEAQPAVVHGDFGLHNVLWTGNRITGVIDFDHATIGDPAMDIAPLIGQFGAAKVAQICDNDMLLRAKHHRASLPLQVAAAAELANDVKLRDHALGNFHKRFQDGTLYDPAAT